MGENLLSENVLARVRAAASLLRAADFGPWVERESALDLEKAIDAFRRVRWDAIRWVCAFTGTKIELRYWFQIADGTFHVKLTTGMSTQSGQDARIALALVTRAAALAEDVERVLAGEKKREVVSTGFCGTCGLLDAPTEGVPWLAEGYCWALLDGDGEQAPEGKPTIDCLRRALDATQKVLKFVNTRRSTGVQLAEVVALVREERETDERRVAELESRLRRITDIINEKEST